MSKKGSSSGKPGPPTATMPNRPVTHGYNPAEIPPKPTSDPGSGYVPSPIPGRPSSPKPSQGGGRKK